MGYCRICRSIFAPALKLCMVGLLALACSLASQRQASAWYDGNTDVNTDQRLGTCTLTMWGIHIGYYIAGIFIEGTDIHAGGQRILSFAADASLATVNNTPAFSSTTLEACGLRNVKNLTQTFDGATYAELTTVSLTFSATLPVGQTASATSGTVTGDGGNYDFVYSLQSQDANSQPVLTATVTPNAALKSQVARVRRSMQPRIRPRWRI